MRPTTARLPGERRMGQADPGREDITGVILAGGLGRRMAGSDKGLEPFAGRPLIEWVIDALSPQVNSLLISANRNHEIYAGYGIPMICDLDAGFKGPLAGIASAMHVAQTDWIVTAPCDGPLLPADLVRRLIETMRLHHANLAVATDGERIQPVYALLPVTLGPALDEALARGEQQVGRWILDAGPALADFSDQRMAFSNINSHADAEKLARDIFKPRR